MNLNFKTKQNDNVVYYVLILSLIISLLLISKLIIKDTNIDLTNDEAESGAINISVSRGDTLSSIMHKISISNDDKIGIIEALRKIYNPRSLSEGQEIEFIFDDETENLSMVHIELNKEKSIEISRTQDGFNAKEVIVPLDAWVSRSNGIIHGSFFSSARNSGISYNLLNDIVKLFSYDIDFERDLQEGDEFEIIYEKLYNQSGNFVKNGNIVYVSIATAGDKLKLYSVKNKHGEYEYYNEKGETAKKPLLKTPLNMIKVSSKFGMRRHPILGYTKLHKGVDFSAPTGTPVFAAGSGRIVKIGKINGYGKYIKINHGTGYATAYAHLSKFNSVLRNGSYVKQGDVIGYVGSTGRATAPHLHYEVLVNDQQVNPLSIKMHANNVLLGQDLLRLKKQIAYVDDILQNTEKNTIFAKN